MKGTCGLAWGIFLAKLFPQIEMPGPDSQVIWGFCQNGSGSQVQVGSVSLHKSIMMLVMLETQVTGKSQVPRYVPHSDKFKTKVCHDQQRQYKNACFLGAGK